MLHMKASLSMFQGLKNRAIRWICDQLEERAEQNEAQYRDWLKTQLKHCGKGVCFNGRINISGTGSVVIGDNVHIGDNAFIQGAGGLEIGDNTHISRNLVLLTRNHNYSGTRLPYDDRTVEKPVRIGRNVWIGMNVCIVPGTTIGDGAIVGMGTVAFGKVPDLAIIGSASWRQIGEREPVHYSRLEQSRAYGGVNGRSITLR